LKNLGSPRGRLGYAADRFLIYATGGWAWGTLEISSATLPTESNALNGYALGAGVEYGVTPSLSVKGEYLYANLGSKNYFVDVGCSGLCDVGASVSTFRLGANWRFAGLGP
jgi:outer membrane immunogenic protein